MTVAAARALPDGMTCFVGIGLPSTAANLARATHAPDLVLIYESGTIGAKPDRLPLSIGDGDPRRDRRRGRLASRRSSTTGCSPGGSTSASSARRRSTSSATSTRRSSAATTATPRSGCPARAARRRSRPPAGRSSWSSGRAAARSSRRSTSSRRSATAKAPATASASACAARPAADHHRPRRAHARPADLRVHHDRHLPWRQRRDDQGAHRLGCGDRRRPADRPAAVRCRTRGPARVRSHVSERART